MLNLYCTSIIVSASSSLTDLMLKMLVSFLLNE